jgi:hypothetical protein
MTLQCDYHHKLLHEGAFSIVKEEDGTLRFVTADGRTIPRNGYRLEDFVDDDIGGGVTQTRHVTPFAPLQCSAKSETTYVKPPPFIVRGGGRAVRRSASRNRSRARAS